MGNRHRCNCVQVYVYIDKRAHTHTRERAKCISPGDVSGIFSPEPSGATLKGVSQKDISNLSSLMCKARVCYARQPPLFRESEFFCTSLSTVSLSFSLFFSPAHRSTPENGIMVIQFVFSSHLNNLPNRKRREIFHERASDHEYRRRWRRRVHRIGRCLIYYSFPARVRARQNAHRSREKVITIYCRRRSVKTEDVKSNFDDQYLDFYKKITMYSYLKKTFRATHF